MPAWRPHGPRHRLGVIREAREGVKAGLEHAVEFDQMPGHPGPEVAEGLDRTEAPPVITTWSEPRSKRPSSGSLSMAMSEAGALG